MTDITLIAAVDRHGAIGRDGALPWRLPGDLARFARRTLGRTVLMGRRTALSIGGPLAARRNVVLSREHRAPYPGQTTVRSIDEALKFALVEDLYVIGGGEVYAALMPYATRLALTHVDTDVEGADTWFPLDDLAGWTGTDVERHDRDERHAYAFTWADYIRKEADHG